MDKTDNIVYGLVHSIWNDGEYDLQVSCKVNLSNNTIYDIAEIKNPPHNLHKLNKEYVELPGGETRQIVYDIKLRGDDSIFYV